MLFKERWPLASSVLDDIEFFQTDRVINAAVTLERLGGRFSMADSWMSIAVVVSQLMAVNGIDVAVRTAHVLELVAVSIAVVAGRNVTGLGQHQSVVIVIIFVLKETTAL